ncbi:MAG: hypothetical protein ACRELY_25775 [Polyangiaceae bacterium]
MGEDDDKPASGEARPATPIEPDLVASLWNDFRVGKVVECPRDKGPMAASVDGASASYRLVCVRCGHATPWFEAKLGIVTHVRGTSTRPPPP